MTVTPLFGRRRQHAAQNRATEAEAERLAGLPRAALAVEVMAGFGPDGPHPWPPGRRAPNLIELTEWLLRGHARPGSHVRALAGPVREALRLLEDAGLVEWRGSEVVGARARLSATALGERALAQGTVRDYLDEEDEEGEETTP